MNKKRILSLCLVLVLLATAVIGGTMAYFTDTDAADNVFTVGNVDIDLHEKNTAGAEDEDYLDWLDDQEMMPGVAIDKIVTVENTGSQAAYVKVVITIPADMEPTWNENTEWVKSSDTAANGDVTWTCTMNAPLQAEETTSALLTAVTLKSEINNLTNDGDYTVPVKVYAIQAAGFESADEAYAALADELKKNTSSVAGTATELNKALADGGSVTLNSNITLVDVSGESGKTTNLNTITKDTLLDLSGKTISIDSEAADGNISGQPILVAVEGGNVTIENGTIDATAGDNGAYGIIVRNGAVVTINEGTEVIGNGTAVQVTEGTLYIKGGKFSNGTVTSGFLLNCVDANWKNGTANIVVTGGSFYGFDPSNNAAEGAGTSFVPFGYTVVENSDWYTVVEAN